MQVSAALAATAGGFGRWQWPVFLAVVIAAIAAGVGLAHLTRRVGCALARRTRSTFDDMLIQLFVLPMAIGWATLAWRIVLASEVLELDARGRELALDLARIGVLATIFVAVMRLVDFAVARLTMARPGRRVMARALLPLGGRVVKLLIAAIAATTILSELGFPVASIVAGLGIGGIALALAAQKTVENLFGAFSIGVDQPFHEGDTIKIGDLTATVEKIGLRSTRLRTPDRTLVTYPNGKLADTPVESFDERDKMRVALPLLVDPATRASQLRAIIADVRAALAAHPSVLDRESTIAVAGITATGIQIDVSVWVPAADAGELGPIKDAILMAFFESVERVDAALPRPVRAANGRGVANRA
jgi:MscS family membrane protein